MLVKFYLVCTICVPKELVPPINSRLLGVYGLLGVTIIINVSIFPLFLQKKGQAAIAFGRFEKKNVGVFNSFLHPLCGQSLLVESENEKCEFFLC